MTMVIVSPEFQVVIPKETGEEPMGIILVQKIHMLTFFATV